MRLIEAEALQCASELLQCFVVRVLVGPGRKISDGHRRLALAVELRQDGSKPPQCGSQVFEMDRSAAIDDGA